MSNEIATYSMILSKLSLGKSGAECPTKTQILAINSLIIIDNASTYGANECVKIDDIRKDVWDYVFSVYPYQVSVGSSGGSGSVTITSYESFNGAHYQDIDYDIDSSTLPSWATFNKNTSTFTISANSSTSSRSAQVYFQQDYSGKRDYASLSQSGSTPTPDTYVFTWDDGSTSDVSASFPWDFSANGTAANIPVISTKNGSSQSWSVSSKPSWITTSTTSSKVTISASDNSGSARSGEVVLTQSGSGNTLTINVSQEAKAADTYSWQIKKSSEPSEDAYWRQSITYDVPAKTTGFSGGYTIKGRKNGEMFAEFTLSSDSPSWLTVSGTRYTVQHNTSSSSRSGTLTLTQAESGLECYIYINQSGYTPTYTFNVTPTNLGVDAITNTYSFTVNSSKTILNDDGSESYERIGWTGTDDADWIYLINASNRPNQIGTVTNETTLQRTAKITLTQDGTGIQAFVNVIQEAGVESNNELYINSINYDSVHLFGNGEVPHLGSQKYFLVSTGVPIHWKTSIGLAVNGGTVYAGDTISVYVSSNNSYTLLRTFALETGVQRVIV